MYPQERSWLLIPHFTQILLCPALAHQECVSLSEERSLFTHIASSNELHRSEGESRKSVPLSSQCVELLDESELEGEVEMEAISLLLQDST